MYTQIEPFTNVAHSVLACNTSSQQVLANRDNRKYTLLINDSDLAIYVALAGTSTGAAAAQTGIRINANGGSYEMTRGLGNLWTDWIFALSTAAAKNLLITEGY